MQIHGNSVQGRILHGNSPSELIECLTKTIGRPPELPEWIISGAVAGMQGGTDAVRRVWDALRDYKVPVSAFWLQVMHVPLQTSQYISKNLLKMWTTVLRHFQVQKILTNRNFRRVDV